MRLASHIYANHSALRFHAKNASGINGGRETDADFHGGAPRRVGGREYVGAFLADVARLAAAVFRESVIASPGKRDFGMQGVPQGRSHI